ncbi:FAD/NAD(P)-binding protein [Maribacter sp. MMG018]|uniref:FAD/NAD(P)-binding protein n=1 Tax=Maribacter sp. MMG018 TaxID=2822688 RepID=UPI001B38AEF7|nr:FAD/NAD(P)-binding protein [Maribacter sp. MMG018]MBQ4915660.1 FAD/NAD(P)-binding protein [Maribacter sp. MMG018]
MSEKIAFVGAGIATSYTLIPFLESLSTKKTDKKIELFIIDKSQDFFKGMPYGNRSGKSVLLIQDLKNFITEPHRTHFKNWLNANIDALSEEFMKNGGQYATQWVEKNSPLYKKDQWDDLYIPRFFFGKYIDEEVRKRLDTLVASNKVSITYVQKETVAIKKNDDKFHIAFDDATAIETDKVILSIGSLPYKKLYSDTIKNNNTALYIKEPYGVGMEENMNQIANFIKNRKKQGLKTKIAVLGANASGLEMIYKICDKLPINEYDTTFKTLSSHGVMPDGTFDAEKAKHFKAKHLQSLAEADNLSASAIAEAAHKDIDEAEKIGLGAATTVGIISKGFGALLPKLSKEELLNFACFHGNQIGRRQRCAGNHYLSVVEELTNLKRFEHLKGRFVGLTENQDGLSMKYKTGESSDSKESTENFNIVINCLGSVNLTADDLSPFLKSLVNEGLCRPNPSKIGFHVDENMQASKNLFIAGPLLAGNQIEDKIFWHLEHCARIIWSSSVLSKKLMTSI